MKVCLISGANRGLGLEFARQLSREGYRVLAGCRNPDHANELQYLIPEKDIFELDVRKEHLIETMAQEIRSWGLQLDLLINNAGIGGDNETLEDLTHEDVLKVFYTNAVGPLLMVKALLPFMKRDSKIVNLSSRMGSIADNLSGCYYSYRMSKAALNMATMNLHRDLAHKSIAVVAVHPGWVRTRMGTQAAPLDPPEAVSGLLKVLQRPGSEISGKFIDYQGTEIPW
jgi:NAD(P)-dependent dehydrogenase (short-subunit alcohol dehydrogenase family)